MPWSLLGILLAVCAVLCAVGFYKFVYFLSIGYGFAVAGGGIAVLVMALVTGSEAPIWVLLIQAALFLAYGIRLSGFLLIREIKNAAYRSPHSIKFHAAPCHRPVSAHTTKVLNTQRPLFTRLPPNGIYT